MAVLCFGIVTTRARAQATPLFLVDSPFDPVDSGIYLVNPSTGTLTLRATIDVTYGPILALAAASDTVFYASGSDSSGCFSCFLYRITLDPASTTPVEILPVGPFVSGLTVIDGVVGLTFREDGTLWMNDEHVDGLYTVDTATGFVTLIGTISTDVLGGDITFDANGDLWMWTNAPSNHGIFYLDLQTAAATPWMQQPDIRMAGLAALTHSEVLYGASPFADRLYEILVPSGFTGNEAPLNFNGSGFDHKRGDLDSPFCSDDAFCDDADACTTDTCTPGGCTNLSAGDCCTTNGACDDGNPCTVDVCELSGPTGTCTHTEDTTACDDGNACTVDTCTPEDGCANVAIGGCCTTDAACADANPCTDDVCELSGATGTCAHPANTAACDDGDACTTGDVCSGGTCQAGTIPTPGELLGLAAGLDKSSFSFQGSPVAAWYDVVRGVVGALPVGPGGSDELCFGHLTSPSFQDGAIPPPGTTFWYIARGATSCAVGTYGNRSNGTPRLTATCP